MKQYLTFNPAAEVSGRVVKSAKDCLAADRLRTILVRHNLDKVDADQWYPMQSWLNCLSEIAALPDSITLFMSIGIRVAQNMQRPTDFAHCSVIRKLCRINELYQMHHRNGDVGRIEIEAVNNHHYLLTCCLPSPDDFFYGALFQGVHETLKDRTFKIVYDYTVPRRDEGGQVTIYHIICSSQDRAYNASPLQLLAN